MTAAQTTTPVKPASADLAMSASEDKASVDANTDIAASGSSLCKIKPQPNYPPNPTLYLSNIDWSIKKPLLKQSLLALFSRHGKVLEIICLRGDSIVGQKCLRGQAWVIFDSLSAATAALHAERGFIFFGRPLMVNYAKEVSDRISKRDGTYSAKSKERRIAKRKMEPGDMVDGEKPTKTSKISNAEFNSSATISSDPSSLGAGSLPKAETASLAAVNASSSVTNLSKAGIQISTVPSPLLLAQNLPPECNEMMLAMLFRQYSGFKDVTFVKLDVDSAKNGGVATIGFETEAQASAALKGLNGFKLNMSTNLDLSFGKK